MTLPDGTDSRDAALVEAARSAPAAIYQFRLHPDGTFSIPFLSRDFALRYDFDQGAPEEMASRFFSRVHADDLEPLRLAVTHSARTLEPFFFEFRFRLSTGVYIPVEARSNAQKLADGGVLWSGIATDMTAHRAMETALRQSERQFRGVLDTLQDAYFRTDLDGRFVLLSPSVATMYRYDSVDELLGQPSRTLYADAEERDRTIAEIRENGSVRDKVGLGRRKDGSTFWISLNAQPWFDEKGDPAGVEGVARDISFRKEAEEALRRKDEILEQAELIGHSGSWTADLVAKTVDFSLACARIRGFTPGLHSERDLFQNIDPRDLDRVRAGWAGTLEGKAQDVEYRIVLNGEVRWLHLISVIENDPGGRPARAIGVIQDITGRRVAEQALRENEEQFRSLFDNTVDSIIATDVEGHIVGWNRGAEAMFGYSAIEVIGQPASIVVPLRHRSRHQAGVERARGEGAHRIIGRTVEMDGLRKDGSEFPIELSLTSLNISSGRFYTAIIRDTTERRRIAEILEASEQRYRVLFENAAEGIVAIDPESGRFLFFNPALCAMFGYTKDEFESLGLSDIHPPEALDRIMREIRVLASGKPLISQGIPCIRRDGTTFAADARGSMVEIGGRRIVFGFFTDITTRVVLEEQLRQAQKMEAVGQLAGGVAHDFNNLLTAIAGFTDLALSDLPLDHPAADSLGEVKKAADRAASLTRQLLAFSRRQVLRPSVINLNDVVRGSEAMLRHVIGEQVEIRTNLAGDLASVLADSTQIEQVILNLALNARDAMPSGGILTLETGNVDLDDAYAVEHDHMQPGHYAVVKVSDSGTGIPADIRGQIFEPFFTTKGPGKGTGLGLSTVYGIVKQSGGWIWVYSEVGQGTTFKIYFPRVTSESPEGPRQERSKVEGAGTGELVLVIEDERQVRNIAAAILKTGGYAVLAVESGTEALDIVKGREKEIELVLSDVVLPGESGPKILDRLREAGVHAPVLFMSGYSSDSALGYGLLGKGVTLLEKPFSRDSLLFRVRQVLSDQAGPASG